MPGGSGVALLVAVGVTVGEPVEPGVVVGELVGLAVGELVELAVGELVEPAVGELVEPGVAVIVGMAVGAGLALLTAGR